MISSDLGVIETMLWDGSQVCPTLSCRNAGGQQRMPDKMHFNAVIEKHKEQCMEEIKTRMVVRRLTPMECERLQGFPDGWSEGQSDTQRYKQLGNSVAIPCVDYILEGIAQELSEVDRNACEESKEENMGR